MRTREKILLLLLTVTLALGALVYLKSRRDDASLVRFRSFLLDHPMRNLSNAITSVTETASDSGNTAIFWYGGLSLFAIVMLGIVFQSAGNAERRVFRDRLVEAQVTKAELESLLQDSIWKEKHARVARETALEELQASASRILALEDRLTANERLLKRQEGELKALRSQQTAVAERPLETRSATMPEQSALRDELRKMAGLVQEKESAVNQLEKNFRDRIDVLETQLNSKEKLMGQRYRELEALRAQLAKAEATKRETELVLAQELRNEKQALTAKDAAMQELEQGLTAKICTVETRLSDHLELLQSRSTELDAVRSEANVLTAQLADVTSAKARADHLLQQELKKKAELLESKDAAFKDLQENSEARVQALEDQLKNQEKLQKEQDDELAALRAQLSEAGTAKNHTESFLAEELRKEKQEREAKDSALKELERNLAIRTHSLNVQLREKEEFLQSRSTELDAVRSEANLLTAQLGDVTSAKERADHLLQQELKKKAELLESKDAAFRELQTNLSATVSHLENHIREKDALLQSRNAELGAATAQLTNMESSRQEIEAQLREELRAATEMLQAKDLTLRERENSSTQLTDTLKKEISEQGRLLKRRDEELVALRSELNALNAQPENIDSASAGAEALHHQQIEDEDTTNPLEEHSKKFAALESSLRDKEDLLKTREEKIARLESEIKEKRTELAKHEISIWQAYERRALWKQRLAKFGISIKD
jgi:chromosome segregation ATPase